MNRKNCTIDMNMKDHHLNIQKITYIFEIILGFLIEVIASNNNYQNLLNNILNFSEQN